MKRFHLDNQPGSDGTDGEPVTQMNAPEAFAAPVEASADELVLQVMSAIRIERSAEKIRIAAQHWLKGKIRNIRLIESDSRGAVVETFFRRHYGDAVSRLWIERDLFGQATVTRAICDCGCAGCVHRTAGAVAVVRTIDLDQPEALGAQLQPLRLRLRLVGAAIQSVRDGDFEPCIDANSHRAAVVEVLDASDRHRPEPLFERGELETAKGGKHDVLLDLEKHGLVPLRDLRGVKLDRSKDPHRFVLTAPGRDPAELARTVQNLVERPVGLQSTAAIRQLCEARDWELQVEDSWPFRVHPAPPRVKMRFGRDGDGLIAVGALTDLDQSETTLAGHIAPIVSEILKRLPDAFVADDEAADEEARRLIRARTPWIKGPDGRWSQLDPRAFAAVVSMFVALESMGRTMHPAASARLGPRFEELEAAGVAVDGEPQLEKIARALATLRDPYPHPTPEGCATTLDEHQQTGLWWLKVLADAELGGILADEPGTGKTLQCLSLMQIRKASGTADRPSLVVGPVAIIEPWLLQARQFYPGLRGVVFHGGDRGRLDDSLAERPDFVVTTHAILRLSIEEFEAASWDVIFNDEAQNSKNAVADIGKAMRRLSARCRITVTGSPIENGLHDLWSHIDFAAPGLLGSRSEFRERFGRPIEMVRDDEESQEEAERAWRELRAIIQPFVLRRTEAETKISLPPLTIHDIDIRLSPVERAIYEALRLKTEKQIREAIKKRGVKRDGRSALYLLIMLRQMCCDARLIDVPKARAPARSAKLKEIMKLVGRLVKEGRKFLIFSEFLGFLRLIEDEIEALGVRYLRLDGATQPRERARDTQLFQEGGYSAYLISKKAGNAAITLTAADAVIITEPFFNPEIDTQCLKRSHRKGQMRPVDVFRLACGGTIEEKILQIQKRKRHLAAIVGDLSLEEASGYSNEDFLDLIRGGAAETAA